MDGKPNRPVAGVVRGDQRLGPVFRLVQARPPGDAHLGGLAGRDEAPGQFAANIRIRAASPGQLQRPAAAVVNDEDMRALAPRQHHAKVVRACVQNGIGQTLNARQISRALLILALHPVMTGAPRQQRTDRGQQRPRGNQQIPGKSRGHRTSLDQGDKGSACNEYRLITSPGGNSSSAADEKPLSRKSSRFKSAKERTLPSANRMLQVPAWTGAKAR